MPEVFISVLVISSIGASLALLLVISERFIADYGECKIGINEGQREFVTKGGKDLLGALVAEKLFIPSACGGRGTCGFCKVKVTAGGGTEGVMPTEIPFLTEAEIEDNVRLSCQVKIRNDLRILIPEELLSIREYSCLCRDITELTYDTKRFVFELKRLETFDFTAGQYVQLLCPRYKGSPEEVYRAYSIASDPAEKNSIELIIRRVPGGICTKYCFEYLKVGDEVKLNGPYGDFKLTGSAAPMVFVAGGSGMAPLVSILHYMVNAGIGREATYFFGGNEQRDIFLVEKMREFESKLDNFKFVPVVARPNGIGWKGQTGLVTQVVQREYEDLSEFEGYLCGSPGMIDASIKVLTKLGMKEDKIYYDEF